MNDFIKLPSDIKNMYPVIKFQHSAAKLEEVTAPTGNKTEQMPAAQELLAVFKEFQEVLEDYTELVAYDGNRMKKVVQAFIQTDQGK